MIEIPVGKLSDAIDTGRNHALRGIDPQSEITFYRGLNYRTKEFVSEKYIESYDNTKKLLGGN